MDLSSPLSSLVPSLDGAVLEVLAGTESALGVSQIRRLARRGARSGIHRVLDRLVGHGLVEAEPTNLGFVYRLNRKHLLAEAVVSAVRAKVGLMERLSAACTTLQPPVVSAALFGSMARGEAGPESDVDLLFVVEEGAAGQEWDEQLLSLEAQIRSWTGNRVEYVVLTRSHLRTLVDDGEPLVESLRADAVDLVGVPIRDLMADRGRRSGP